MTPRTALLLAGLLVGAPTLRADDIHVPADTPSVQFALSIANDGDRVLVSPGVYPHALPFVDKDVEVIGVGGADVTILDASGFAPGPLAIVGPGSNAVLRGLTLRDVPGDAVVVDESATALLEDCVIENAAGHGVFTDGALTMTRTVVRGSGGTGVTVGAFGIGTGSGTLDDCEISGSGGGGVVGDFVCTRCVIADNDDANSFAVGGAGYGATLVDCVVARNSAGSVALGGRDLDDVSGTVFLDNGYSESSSFGAGISGATFVNTSGDPADVVVGLSASSDVFFPVTVGVAECVFVDCTVELFANSATSAPWTSSVSACTLIGCDVELVADIRTITNSILRGGSIVDLANLDVTWSNVEGGAAGTGNIDADPQFIGGVAAGMVCLAPSSPCIDAGNPALTDPDGSPRDIGAVPYTTFCDAGNALRGRLGLPSLTASGATTPGASITLAQERGAPSGSATWILGAAPVFAPLKGGVLVPSTTFLVPGLPLDATGSLAIASTWPAGVPAGTVVWAQAWMVDSAAAKGFSATNGLALIAE